MSDRPRVTKEEAQQFLELYNKIMLDMDETFEEVAEITFSNQDQEESEFIKKWDGKGSLYTVCSRRKIKRFVETMYIE